MKIEMIREFVADLIEKLDQAQYDSIIETSGNIKKDLEVHDQQIEEYKQRLEELLEPIPYVLMAPALSPEENEELVKAIKHEIDNTPGWIQITPYVQHNITKIPGVPYPLLPPGADKTREYLEKIEEDICRAAMVPKHLLFGEPEQPEPIDPLPILAFEKANIPQYVRVIDIKKERAIAKHKETKDWSDEE